MKFTIAFAASVVAAALQLGAQTPPATRAAAAASPPRLVVLFVVDQFRADYVDLYGGQWTQGLHEIFTKGAHFTEAAYPYAATITCVGHNTIGTGTLPAVHGMIGNEWFDRDTHSFVTCTEDPSARSLAFGGATGTEHHSAKWRLVPTFADELKRQAKRTRIVSMSGKARSAIGLGGRGGSDTIILWEEDAPGVFATSSALASRTSADVDAYVKAHPILGDRGQNWDRILPAAAYRFADRAPGEPNDGIFPHLLKEPIRTSRTTATFGNLWDGTPFIDRYLGDMAGAMAERLHLGRADGTDFLAVSFSGLDIAGHNYGPRSHEVQDTLARLDQVVGRLLATLDRTVGREHYVLALSADHGVATLPEQLEPSQNGGRVNSLLPAGTAIENLLNKQFGAGSYVEAMVGPYVYFRPGVAERVQADKTLMKTIETAVLGVRGVANLYWGNDITAATPTSDPLMARIRKSYMKGRSGDLVIIHRPNWTIGATGANHGSPYEYDARVPVVLFGAGITPGRYTTSATPVDIAPTLASLTHVTLPHTDGRVLSEALARPAN